MPHKTFEDCPREDGPSEHCPSIDPEISRAWTLPAHFYFDPRVFQREREEIFCRTWQAVGHRDRLSQPGDYFTTELDGEPLLLVRAANGQALGFYNVCRHRAGPPAQGCGSRKIFRCGYHGWTYNLDGKLISAPEFEGVESFAPENFSLKPVAVAEWFSLIFANLDGNAEPLLAGVGSLPSQAARYSLAGMKRLERRAYEVKCNWKTYVDNYLEGYHLPSVHPGLNRELDYASYTTEVGKGYVRQFSPIREPQPGDSSPRRYQGAPESLTADYFWIFPNWMLNCYPDNISLNLVVPRGPEQSLVIFEWYVPPELAETQTAQRAVSFSDEIQAEDAAICETVQINLASRSYERGRYSVKQEQGVHAFHRLYAAAMGRPEPSGKQLSKK